jgi:hypothetical protein
MAQQIFRLAEGSDELLEQYAVVHEGARDLLVRVVDLTMSEKFNTNWRTKRESETVSIALGNIRDLLVKETVSGRLKGRVSKATMRSYFAAIERAAIYNIPFSVSEQFSGKILEKVPGQIKARYEKVNVPGENEPKYKVPSKETLGTMVLVSQTQVFERVANEIQEEVTAAKQLASDDENIMGLLAEYPNWSEFKDTPERFAQAFLRYLYHLGTDPQIERIITENGSSAIAELHTIFETASNYFNADDSTIAA